MPEPGTHPVQGDHLRESVWIEIRTVLRQHWDPIGVAEEPGAADEYYGYIPKIKSRLRSGASIEVLMDYLDWIASARMSFTPQRERGRLAAHQLVALRSHLEPLRS